MRMSCTAGPRLLALWTGMMGFSCGAGVTSTGDSAPSMDGAPAETDGLVTGITRDGAISDAGQSNVSTASGAANAADGQSSRAADGSPPGATDGPSSGPADAPSSGDADDGQSSVPQAFVSVSLAAYYDPNHNQQNLCNSFKSTTEVFAIGLSTGTCDPRTGMCTGTGPVRVQDGQAQSGGATVNIKCSVNGSYDINLQASLGAIGSLQIAGHVDASSGGQGVSADITYQGTDYQATNSCAVTFTYLGAPVPVNPPIAPGRIWAHLSCPQMGDPAGVRRVKLMDMSLVPEVCDGEADFLFENCSQ